jgi:pimeloyl-ACP methyl ester carboxylesterase
VLERTIQVDGVPTCSLSAGSGPPLVLLHGAGNSLGGLAALQLALSQPQRITALCLVDSAGLGRVGRRRPGAALRALARAVLLFGRPWRTPRSWLVEQYRAARQPGFLEVTLASLRAVLGPLGRRQVLAKRLAELTMPTLIVWGTADWVIPVTHGRRAARRLPSGDLVQLPWCGHAPPGRVPRTLRPSTQPVPSGVRQR